MRTKYTYTIFISHEDGRFCIEIETPTCQAYKQIYDMACEAIVIQYGLMVDDCSIDIEGEFIHPRHIPTADNSFQHSM